MRAEDRTAFVAALLELAALKRAQKDVTAEFIGGWWNIMQDWDISDFKGACAQLARTVEFMPNPFHFEQLRRAALPSASEQWARALDHAKNLPHHRGFPQERPTGDAVLDAAVRCVGGYTALALMDRQNLHFTERRFAEHYEGLAHIGETRAALPGLIKSTVKQLKGRLSPGCQRS